MKFHEWVKWFEDKSGEKFYLPPYFNLEFDEEKGFITWKKEGNIMYLDQCASQDHDYWDVWLFSKVHELGCNKFRSYVRRNIKAYMRMTNSHIVEKLTDLVTGEDVYLMEREVSKGEGRNKKAKV